TSERAALSLDSPFELLQRFYKYTELDLAIETLNFALDVTETISISCVATEKVIWGKVKSEQTCLRTRLEEVTGTPEAHSSYGAGNGFFMFHLQLILLIPAFPINSYTFSMVCQPAISGAALVLAQSIAITHCSLPEPSPRRSFLTQHPQLKIYEAPPSSKLSQSLTNCKGKSRPWMEAWTKPQGAAGPLQLTHSSDFAVEQGNKNLSPVKPDTRRLLFTTLEQSNLVDMDIKYNTDFDLVKHERIVL
ncbi:hypothetical protein DV515_00012438, partial [Chloebia gouldiae]